MELLGVRVLIETLAAAATCAVKAVDAWITRVEERCNPIKAGMDAGYDCLLWALLRPLERDPKAKKTS